MENLLRAADFVSMFSIVLAVYAAGVAMMLYRKNHLNTKKYEKRKYTYEFCLERHEVLNKLFLNIPTDNEYLYRENIRIDSDKRRIIEIFNEISIGVNHDLLDEDIVRSMFEGVFISFFKENKYLMFTAGDKLNNPYLFNEFQILNERWQREPMKSKRFSK